MGLSHLISIRLDNELQENFIALKQRNDEIKRSFVINKLLLTLFRCASMKSILDMLTIPDALDDGYEILFVKRKNNHQPQELQQE